MKNGGWQIVFEGWVRVVLSREYLTMWVDPNPTRLVNMSRILNPNTTRLINKSCKGQYK